MTLPSAIGFYSATKIEHDSLLSLSTLFLTGMLMVGCQRSASDVERVEIYFRNEPVELQLAGSVPATYKVAAALSATEVKRLDIAFEPLNSRGLLYTLNNERSSHDAELILLLHRAQSISEMTGGRYNLFLDYPEKAYGFDKHLPQPPTIAQLAEIMLPIRRASLEIVIETPLARMPNDAYGISLSGLLEGYVVDQALAHLRMAGVPQGMVRMGSFAALGASPNGLGWPIDILHPIDDEIVTTVHLENMGIATASVMDEAFVYRNQTYYNNLDPITGLPARRLMSATVIAPTSEVAGALAKGIFTMVPLEGIFLINQLPEVEGLLIDAGGQVWRSDSLFNMIGG